MFESNNSWSNNDEQRKIESMWHTHVGPINSNLTSFSLLSDVTLAACPAGGLRIDCLEEKMEGLVIQISLNCLNQKVTSPLAFPKSSPGCFLLQYMWTVNDTHVLASPRVKPEF